MNEVNTVELTINNTERYIWVLTDNGHCLIGYNPDSIEIKPFLLLLRFDNPKERCTEDIICIKYKSIKVIIK